MVDTQLKADLDAGRMDPLIDQARDDYHAGRTTPLCPREYRDEPISGWILLLVLLAALSEPYLPGLIGEAARQFFFMQK
jgi:hypothetical protein